MPLYARTGKNDLKVSDKSVAAKPTLQYKLTHIELQKLRCNLIYG